MTYPNEMPQPQDGDAFPQGSDRRFAVAERYGEPDNHLVWAILSTVLCCVPLGIVSIVKSVSVGKLWAQGDYVGAQQAAEDARKWAVWSAVIGCVLVGLVFVLFIAMSAVSTSVEVTP